MTRFGKKLSLSRETVRELTPEEMGRVGGAGSVDGMTNCPRIQPTRDGHACGGVPVALDETTPPQSNSTYAGWGGTCNPCPGCLTQPVP